MTRLINRFKFMKVGLIFALTAGLVFASCSKDDDPVVPPTDKSALQAAITAAQAIYDAAVEGTKPG